MKKNTMEKNPNVFEDANVLVFETTLMLITAWRNGHDYDGAKSELRNDRHTDSWKKKF